MPMYEYQCSKCSYIFEHFTFSAAAGEDGGKCPSCGSAETRKILSPFSSGVSQGSPGSSRGCGPVSSGFS